MSDKIQLSCSHLYATPQPENNVTLIDYDSRECVAWEFEKISDSDNYNNFKLTNNKFYTNSYNAERLSKKWNNFNVYSFVIVLHDDMENYNTAFTVFEEMMKSLKKIIHASGEHLAIIENSPTKGYHLHLLHFQCRMTEKVILNEMLKSFEKVQIKYTAMGFNQEDRTEHNIKFIITGQIIKSVASYIHYLRKNPIAIWSDNYECLEMYFNFRRDHVFPNESIPKLQKNKNVKVNSKNPLITLIYNMFGEGKLDFNTIMKDNRIHPYLMQSNIRQVFENCYLNYSTNMNHVKNLTLICNKFRALEDYEKCCCPVIEFLEYQGIDLKIFMEKLFKWLNCSEKRNAFWLFGPPDCGKSYLARMLWNCFALNKRICSDGIFSFAELDGAGCALWDEPFIGPDTADQTKLVLEGQPDVTITKKGKPPQKLNKRVPVIITSNNELSKYCSSEFDAFKVRTYRFNFSKIIEKNMWCTGILHYCPFIDATDSPANPFKDNTVHQNKRRRTSQEIVYDCKGYHPILNNHAISFIVRTLVLYRSNFVLDRTITAQDHVQLAEAIKSCEGLFCACSENLILANKE